MIHATFNDPLLRTFLFALIVDLLLGVLAAVKAGSFQIGYLPRTLRDDLLLKGVPLLVLVAGSKAAGDVDIVIPGLDLGDLAAGAFALAIAGLAASILSSVHDLFPALNVPSKLNGGDQTAPK